MSVARSSRGLWVSGDILSLCADVILFVACVGGLVDGLLVLYFGIFLLG